jgi:molybdopterin converting factor small subunit
MIDVDLPEGAKVADLRAQIGTRYPALRVLLERSALAVNDEFVADTSTIPREAEIAVLPPVSGGSGSVFSG